MTRVCKICGVDKPLSAYRLNARKSGYRLECRACGVAASMAWARKNPKKAGAIASRYAASHRDSVTATKQRLRDRKREEYREYWAQWRSANRDRSNQYARDRQATVKRATPSWLSAIQLAQIAEFYDIAVARSAQTGVPHQVDHIHTLRGKTFNGLHVPWNLQVITAEENLRKGAKFVEVP